MRIKPGCGYYDVTVFPIGGSFRRAPTEGIEVNTTRSLKGLLNTHGCDLEGITRDGRTVCFSSKHAEDSETISIKR